MLHTTYLPVFLPTPGKSFTFKLLIKSSTSSFLTINWPFGFPFLVANLAIRIFGPTPSSDINIFLNSQNLKNF